MANQDGNFIDDPEGFSGAEFSLAYWWALHKHQLRKWWVASFAIVVVMVVLYDLFFLTIATATWIKHNRVVTGIVENAITIPTNTSSVAAASLQAGDVVVTQRISGYADFIAPVTNPNATWAVERVEYRFAFGDSQTPVETAQLLPEEETYFVAKNVDVPDTGVTTATLQIVDVVWRRTTREQLRVPEFEVRDVELSETVTTDGRAISRVNAIVRNVSVRDFNEMAFVVVLFDDDDNVVALQEQTISDFRSLEEEALIVTFNQEYPLAERVQILPRLELF